MSYQIANAVPADAASIAEFQVAMALETENKKLDAEIVLDAVKAVFDDASRGRYLVAKQDNLVVASLLITYEWSDWRNSNMWYIQSVFVRPEHRRKGIFSLMYQRTVELAKEENVRFVRLYVETENQQAQLTYEKHGMKRLPYFMYQADLQ